MQKWRNERTCCWRPKALAVMMDPCIWFPFIFLLCSLCLRFLFVFLSNFSNQEDDGEAGLLWIGCWFWVFCKDKNNGENQYPSLCCSLIFLFFRCFFFALFCALFGFPLSPCFFSVSLSAPQFCDSFPLPWFFFLVCVSAQSSPFKTKTMAVKARGFAAGWGTKIFPVLSLFVLPPFRSLIFSGFIAREYQPFRTTSKPLLPETAPEEEGEEGDEQLLKTVSFVRWKWPFSIWSLNFWNRAIKPLCKL